MVRRIVVAKPSIDNVRQIQSSIRRVAEPFNQKTDVEKALFGEIEACRGLIWQCVGGQADLSDHFCSDALSRKIDKQYESTQPSASTNKDIISNGSEKSEQPNRVGIEFRVNAMKVVELRQELKCRDLETTGLKKQLQIRLREAMINESSGQTIDNPQSRADFMKPELLIDAEKLETSVVEEVNVERCDESNQVIDGEQKSIQISQDINIHKKYELTHEEGTDLKPAGQVSPANSSRKARELKINSGEGQSMEVNESAKHEEESEKRKMVPCPKKRPKEGASTIKQYWKKLSKPANSNTVTSPIKVTAIAQSESKGKKSPIRMVVKTVQKVLPSENTCPSQDLVIAESKSDLTDDDFDGPISEFSEASAPVQMSKAGSVRDLVSKIQNGASSVSTSGGIPGSGSALSKNLQAKKEARLARMAEIRGKSKPVSTSKHVLAPKEYASTLSSLNAVSAPVGMKKNNLAAQMREKAATAAMRKDNISSGVNQAMVTTAESPKRDIQSSIVGLDDQNNPVLHTTMEGFCKKQKVASPMSTYEISDREESDSDSGDSESENEKRKKKIPLWAQKANLLPALEQQYNGCIGGRRVDPDEIFPEVQTCDLEAIFGGKKSRYTRRTSSGNWTNDKVTTAEKLVYKRTMGFASHA